MNLELKNITFSYPHKIILNDLCAFFESAKIHAVIGENGEGKTTTAKIITGELKQHGGEILIDNEKVSFNKPSDAIQRGICYVHQIPMLCDSLTIKENLILGLKKIDKNQIKKTAEIFLNNINLNTLLCKNGSDIKFFTSLCNALLKNPKLLILDEPSALLTETQIDFLYTKLNQLKKNGMNIIVITHHLDEAKKYCDTISRLKSGKLTVDTKSDDFLNPVETDNSEITTKDFPSMEKTKSFTVEKLCCSPSFEPALKDINFTVREKEILCIKGQTEDGLKTLEELLTGLSPYKASGKITITSGDKKIQFNANYSSKDLRFKSPLKTGIIPTDKKNTASNPSLKIHELLEPYKMDADFCKKIINKTELKISENQLAEELSGGMLQKLILQRELVKNPELLILCHPLQGLDSVSAKKTIQKIKAYAENGAAVIILTQGDFPKEKCNKYYILNHGRLEDE
ncbi:MAG: ATP-binding cassette domain-containing protein [Treponema sp.]|nr:ATP-binding cassette domain-containing protein [Treponema sp.]